jgi:hypothetical protein
MDTQAASQPPVHPGAGAHPDIRRMDSRLRECIGHCSGCHNLCMDTVAHCLDLGGKHASREHVGLLLDCADLCRTSADLMLRGSPFHGQVCAVCADVCQRCAEECERLAGDDELMRHCAELCRRCAAACREMAGTLM